MTPTHRSHDMTDNLREALEDMARCDQWPRFSFDEVQRRARAALAAAPQPARINRSHLVATISNTGNLLGWRGDTIADDLMSRFDITLRNSAAPQPAELCQFCHDAGASSCACLQPAPEQGMTRAEVGQMLDAKRHDREALVEVIKATAGRTMGENVVIGGAGEIADALLARGLRLPGEDETMAWAVVGKDGAIIPGSVWTEWEDALPHTYREGARGVRVAIRVVEVGDDAE